MFEAYRHLGDWDGSYSPGPNNRANQPNKIVTALLSAPIIEHIDNPWNSSSQEAWRWELQQEVLDARRRASALGGHAVSQTDVAKPTE